MTNNAKQPHAPERHFQKAKRCGAKTRSGSPCRSPAVRGKNRCRMHGCAKDSGAPKGNQNALKHGFYTKKNLILQKKLKLLLNEFKNNISKLNGR